MMNLKINTNERICKTETDCRYTEQTSGQQWGVGSGEGYVRDRGLRNTS